MKLPCNVIEDMLPMYHDGVCSQESAELVLEHLKECPRCSRTLCELRSDIPAPGAPLDDLKPLAGIQAQWKKEKRRSVRRGARLTLAILLSVFLVWTCVWYFGHAIHYDRLARELEKISGEAASMTTAHHALKYGDYGIVLKKPGFLGGGGFVRIGPSEGLYFILDEDWNVVVQNTDMCVDLFFYPQPGGGYHCAVMFDDGQEMQWVWITPELTYNYDLYDSAEAPAEEIAHLEQLLADYREDIAALTDVAKEVWGIDLRA